MTVSRSLFAATPRSRAPATASSARARTCGERPLIPWDRTAGTAVAAVFAKAAEEATTLRRRATQKTWARFLKLRTAGEGAENQVSITRSRPPDVWRALPSSARFKHGHCKTAHLQWKFLRILLLPSPLVQPRKPSAAVLFPPRFKGSQPALQLHLNAGLVALAPPRGGATAEVQPARLAPAGPNRPPEASRVLPDGGAGHDELFQAVAVQGAEAGDDQLHLRPP